MKKIRRTRIVFKRLLIVKKRIAAPRAGAYCRSETGGSETAVEIDDPAPKSIDGSRKKD